MMLCQLNGNIMFRYIHRLHTRNGNVWQVNSLGMGRERSHEIYSIGYVYGYFSIIALVIWRYFEAWIMVFIDGTPKIPPKKYILTAEVHIHEICSNGLTNNETFKMSIFHDSYFEYDEFTVLNILTFHLTFRLGKSTKNRF